MALQTVVYDLQKSHSFGIVTWENESQIGGVQSSTLFENTHKYLRFLDACILSD